MKKHFYNFIFIFFLSLSYLTAQNTEQLATESREQSNEQVPREIDLINIPKDDLDSLFDEPAEYIIPITQTPETSGKNDNASSSVISNIRKRGIEFIAAYNFKGIFNPGYEVLPWEIEDEEISYSYGAEMSMKLTTNAQISEFFKVKNEIIYEIPGGKFELGDFFFDYNFLNIVFFRAGKFEQKWGVSPNFAFTDLLARIAIQSRETKNKPNEPPTVEEGVILYDGKNFFYYEKDSVATNKTSYIMKADIPIGIGGLQLLALTRANLLSSSVKPRHNHIGYGGKFNLAFNWAEFNLGYFMQDYMAKRTYLSVKTNILDTDIYSEYLLGINDHYDDSIGYAFNFGFTKSFFNDKLTLNAEYFYNKEEPTTYYSPETDFTVEGELPFLADHNYAFNVLYKFGGKINPRIFANLLYGDDSYSLTMGGRITPLPNINVYLAAQMAIGDGYYYNDAKDYFSKVRPFRVMLYVSFSGSVRVSHYY